MSSITFNTSYSIVPTSEESKIYPVIYSNASECKITKFEDFDLSKIKTSYSEASISYLVRNTNRRIRSNNKNKTRLNILTDLKYPSSIQVLYSLFAVTNFSVISIFIISISLLY